MYWTAHLNDPVSLGLHNAILNNVDFQDIYDYFFDPAKVKGQPYKPLQLPSFTEAVVVGKSSEAAAKNAADPAVVFFEDFSSSAVGKKPLNWRSTLDRHRRLQCRHGVEGTGRSLGGDGRHGGGAYGHEDAPAA